MTETSKGKVEWPWKLPIGAIFLLCGVAGQASGQQIEHIDTTVVNNIGPFPSQVVVADGKVAIGATGVEGDETEHFFSRVASVVMLEGSRVAVADGATAEVRLFAADGALEASSPGRGDGPGEFRSLDWLAECREGQLDAYDAGLGRITTFSSADLAVLDTRQLQSSAAGAPPSAVRCFRGGWVGGTRHLQAPPPSPGPVQWPVSVEIFDSSGQAYFVTRLPGDERYFDGGSLGPLAFGTKSVFAASRTHIVVGAQGEPEVAVYGQTGALSHLVRWRTSSLPITDQDVELFVNRRRAPTDEERAALRRRYRDYPFPERYPAFGDMLLDDAGHLWVEGSQRLGATENKWWVFSPSGHVVQTVSFPSGFRPMDISPSSGRAAGVYTDSLSVEFVWVLDLPALP